MTPVRLTNKSYKFFSPLTASVAVVTGLVSLIIGTSSVQAQTIYTGDAYGVNLNLNLALVGIGATIVDNPNLPAAGSATPLTNSLATLDAKVTTGGILPNIFTVANAGIINTSTVGSAGTVTSVSTVNGLNLLPSITDSLPILNTLHLDALVETTLIRTTTTANAVGGYTTTGRTEIANLVFGGNVLGNFDLNQNAASQTFYLRTTGALSATASANILVPDVARLIINNQFLTGNTRTTEALRLDVFPLLGQVVNGNVTVASSSAGIQIPEPGSIVFALAGGATLLGMVARRKRQN